MRVRTEKKKHSHVNQKDEILKRYLYIVTLANDGYTINIHLLCTVYKIIEMNNTGISVNLYKCREKETEIEECDNSVDVN